MFKTEGGGQRPFEQCSKKLQIWWRGASLMITLITWIILNILITITFVIMISLSSSRSTGIINPHHNHPNIGLLHGEKRLAIGSGLALHQYYLHPQYCNMIIIVVIITIICVPTPYWDRVSLKVKSRNLCIYDLVIEWMDGSRQIIRVINRMVCTCSLVVLVVRSFCKPLVGNTNLVWHLWYAGKFLWPSPDIWNITAAGIAVAILQ